MIFSRGSCHLLLNQYFREDSIKENKISIDKLEAFFTSTTFGVMRYDSRPGRFSGVGDVGSKELLAFSLIAVINVTSILIKVLINV